MKKTMLLLAAITLFSFSFASTTPGKDPVLRADKIFFPVGKTGKTISLLELSEIKIKDFEKLTGKKMKFFDRLSFKAAQKKVSASIDYDGTINNKKLNKLYNKAAKGEGGGGGIGGFALGFLLGLIGVLIAYLINDDYKRNRVKWAWIGFGAWVIILIILLAVGASVV